MMSRGGRRVARPLYPNVGDYQLGSFADKRRYAMTRAGIAQEPLYQCRLCEVPVKVTERDRKGHVQRSHPEAEKGKAMRLLFRKVRG